MQLFVRGQTLHTFEVTGGESVFDIKKEVALAEGLPADEQVLFYSGTPLNDELSLVDCGVANLCTLEVGLRLLGGEILSNSLLKVESLVSYVLVLGLER